jgi:protein-L-isoaspartate(D-aspartate) O-methyltransferase
MLETPRELYVPDAQKAVAYTESAIALGDGREVLEPRTLAKMLDALDVERQENVLVIGANHGYATALMAHMATSVVAVEEDEAIARDAEEALSSENVDNAAIMAGSLVEGQPKAGPFDVILIEGGVERVPDTLLDQLAEGGRIGAIFMEGAIGQARVGVKAEGRIGWRFAFNATAPILPGFAEEKAFAL